VAILGAPGSGKTTIVNLIPRFYDPVEGSVTIDGTDIKDVTLDSLRRNVGMVFQDVFLFHTTISENLSYGANGVTDAQVEEAAKAAQLHEHIVSLPDGYKTQVGERGVTLSGGQRQRLAIARTLLLNPPILILDDSTSSVDVETEALIRKALAQVMKERTTFIIAHRVSSVIEADLILVLRDGEIVERGTHQELIRREGFYKQIYELQLLPAEQVFLEASVGDERDD
jgi:ATP-binding cassette subfamily B protein